VSIVLALKESFTTILAYDIEVYKYIQHIMALKSFIFFWYIMHGLLVD
jgi:hypothetical protein